MDPVREQKMLVLLGNAAFNDQVVRQNLGLLTDRIGMVTFIGSIATNVIELLHNVDQRERSISLLPPTVALMQALRNILLGLQEWSQHPDELVLALQKVPVDFQPLHQAIEQFEVVHEAEITRLGIREGVGQSPLVDQSFMATISMCRAFETIYSANTSNNDVPAERIDLLRTLSMPLLSPGLRTDASRSFWFAVKLACACLIGLIFINATQFNSFGTMIVTPLMVVGATGGSSEGTRARAKLRLLGTIVGAAVSIFAIIFLIPTADSISALLLIWIGCAAPLVWILNGGPKISYLGVQAIFCLTIAIGSTFHPSIDLTPASTRIVGIFLGTLVTLGIFNVFAPDFARNELLGMFSLMLERLGTLATMGLPNNPGTIGDITQLRLRIMSLVLRARGLGQNLQSESRASEPTMTNDQVTEIAQHMTLMLYSMNALALNRVASRLMPTTLLNDLAEMHACAEAIKHACELGANGVSTQNYREFDSAAKALDAQSKHLVELTPQIRLRPSIRVMDAKSVEFILGQVGMYRVAAVRLRDFASLLMRFESQRNAQLHESVTTTQR